MESKTSLQEQHTLSKIRKWYNKRIHPFTNITDEYVVQFQACYNEANGLLDHVKVYHTYIKSHSSLVALMIGMPMIQLIVPNLNEQKVINHALQNKDELTKLSDSVQKKVESLTKSTDVLRLNNDISDEIHDELQGKEED